VNSVQFLDEVRTKLGLDSDNKLARELGIERARISAYRTGRRKLDPDAAVAVAKALGLPPEHVFAAVAAERAKRTEHRKIWERLAKYAKNLHVLAVVGVIGAGAITPRPAGGTSLNAGNIHYAPFGDRRRRRRVLVDVDRRGRPDRRGTPRPAVAA
jgi:transcriptional regulator with XRE-family HTH domain